MLSMKKCPKCGAYMMPYVTMAYGGCKLVYSCQICEYSTDDVQLSSTSHTVIDENAESTYTDHT